jgi:hypothetical protein
MRIVDLDAATERAWLMCLKEWGPEPLGTAHRADWYRRLKSCGVRVKLAITDDGIVGGTIQYVPIEYSMAIGHHLYFVQCTWVHGYEEGPGNLQHRGMGKALLAAAEEDVKHRGAQGLAAWGNTFPGWMPVAWLLKQGYEEADRKGSRVLVWKRFSPDADAPKWRVRRKTPERIPGKVVITALFNPWCGDACDFYERVAGLAQTMKDKVQFTRIDTSRPEALDEWGLNNAVFVNDQQITGGIERLKEVIEKELRDQAIGTGP